ncbi:MAG: rhodanese-like domain-containing protein [Micropruina sp.]|uniref:rhodanese-like domain-containing protein n=1 Tax=Micropruina sp. TaxID=2737536 RepID=UPI0039E39C14
MEIAEITVSDLPDDAVVLDVREPGEWAAGHAPGAVHIPLGEVVGRLSELPETDGPLPVICRSGARSERVAAYLLANGIDAVNVAGGTLAWAQAGKPLAADSGDPYVL